MSDQPRRRSRTALVGIIAVLVAFANAAPAQTPAMEKTIGSTASRWGAYAIETHKRIEKHLKANRDIFKFRSDLYVELWIDPTGRVTRTRVTGASGNRATDAMTGPDFPPGLILPAPAKDMPQPIKVKINADR